MQKIAILSPTNVEATPEQQVRARQALMQQMLLLAKGYSVDSEAVRMAAELVCSAVAPDPMEVHMADDSIDMRTSLSATAERLGDSSADSGETVGTTARGDGTPAWQKTEGYARYMRTIMSASSE